MTRALAVSTQAVSPAFTVRAAAASWAISPGCVDRGALHLVGIHGGEGVVVTLARANANHRIERVHEDLAVAYVAGAGRRENRRDGGLHERLGDRHFDFDLLAEFGHDRAAPVLLHHLALAAVACHAAEGDAGNAGSEERCLDLR
jgi:hypothetical protein